VDSFCPSSILISEFGFPIFDESLKQLDAERYDLESAL
jgi:hypothetical protein